MNDRPDIVVSLELVTPEGATRLLKGNTHNRRVSDAKVTEYARLMKNDLWAPGSSMISLTKESVVVDGQHRLLAVQKSGTSQWFVFAIGLTEESQDTMDAHTKRTLAGQLQIQEVPLARSVAALTVLAARWSRGMRGQTLWSSTGSVGYPNLTEGRLFVEENPALLEAARMGEHARQKGVTAPGSVYAMLYWLTSQIDQDDADVFFEKLISGEMLASNDPIFHARKSLETRRDSRDKESMYITLARLIKAWNMWRRGETTHVLMWRPGGRAPEKFPEAV